MRPKISVVTTIPIHSQDAVPAAGTPEAVQDLLAPLRAWLDAHPTAAIVIGPLILIALDGIGYWGLRGLLLWAARKITARTTATWDDVLFESRFLHRLSLIAPLAIVYWTAPLLRGIPEPIARGIVRLCAAGMVLSVAFAITAFLDGLHRIYKRRYDARRRPIKGYLQLISIAVYIAGGLMAGAVLLDRNVGDLFVGLGLSTAVVLLIFKDTILALVASIQLTANDMVRVGDWIEIPQAKADGDVIEVALHTVKIQNWDKTVSTVPTHKLYAESFKNWRGMQESGGRRVKRSLTLDVNSVRFLEREDVERLKKLRLLEGYLEDKQNQLEAHHSERGGFDSTTPANNRRLTNLGTFRAYVAAFLHSHPDVHSGMTLLVRQLQQNALGVPLELYLFTKTTAWGEYERIQADIFDHLFAVVPEFGLRVSQQPTGSDFARWPTSLAESTKL